MSLYDEASLIAYPSGYKESKIYAQKPIDGTGDLTFTRASSATRVNSDGLIETASIIGSELIVNGDFASGTGWSLVGDFAISGGKASITSASQYSQLTSQGTNFLTSGNQYKLQVDIETLSISGAFAYRFTGGAVTPILTSQIVDGKFEAIFTMPSDGYLWFQTTGSYTGLNVSIDNVSVKEVITSNVPRIDYSNGCGSLLLEPQRTNLVTQSKDFGTWDNTTYPITVSTNAIASPSGFVDATLLTPNSGNSRHAIRETVSCSATTYTLSAFYKKDNAQYIQLSDGGDSAWHIVTADLDNGTITNEINATGTIEPYANDWYRITCTFTRTNANTIQAFIGASPTDSNSGLPSFNDTSLTTYAYGAQLEQGSYPTSYIPTSGTTVTRIKDTSSTTGLSSVIGQTEGTLFVEMASLSNLVTSNYLSISDGSYNNRLSILFSTGTNVIRAFLRLGGSVQCDLDTTAYDITQMNKIAFKYKANDFALWVNGTEVDIDSSGSTFSGSTLTTFAFNEIGTGTGALNGKCQNLMIFPSALTDEQLTDLTGAVQTSFNSLALSLGYTIL